MVNNDDDLKLLFVLVKLAGTKPHMQEVATAMGLKTSTCQARHSTLMKKLAAMFPEVEADGDGDDDDADVTPTPTPKRPRATKPSTTKAKATTGKTDAAPSNLDGADFVKVKKEDDSEWVDVAGPEDNKPGLKRHKRSSAESYVRLARDDKDHANDYE